ncbi:hypothetical protein JTE90_024231 [Oedothorax gibbosus]|uniref:Uncharacterized protein n=1 Tax=Oedothorax gibbosus TaxID=931172 RepID=A0AAV6TJT3_9ARAC|nr:hypothetical protein JTE90_024231 [Oedothorax gibbosus]
MLQRFSVVLAERGRCIPCGRRICERHHHGIEAGGSCKVYGRTQQDIAQAQGYIGHMNDYAVSSVHDINSPDSVRGKDCDGFVLWLPRVRPSGGC